MATGSAVWEGTLKEGKGTMKLGSGAFEGPYSFKSRFENGAGTNPEELLGAAEAGCFSMALSGPYSFKSRFENGRSTSKKRGIRRNASLRRRR